MRKAKNKPDNSNKEQKIAEPVAPKKEGLRPSPTQEFREKYSLSESPVTETKTPADSSSKIPKHRSEYYDGA